ncbi:hypothetical protein [Spirosoma jeollabukense]
MKRLLLVFLMLSPLSGCKKEDIDTLEQYVGVYTGSFDQSSILKGEIVVTKGNKGNLSFSFTGTTPHLDLTATPDEKGSFTITPMLMQGYQIYIAFSGNGQFLTNVLTLNLYSDYTDDSRNNPLGTVFVGKKQ